MLLRHRPPKLDSRPVKATEGLEHLKSEWLAVLRWLRENRIDFVLVGPVAEAIRAPRLACSPSGLADRRSGSHPAAAAPGPVAIVPAPYGRNYDRLSRALWSAHARMRIEGEADSVPVKMNAEKLARGQHWLLRCGIHDLDIEGRVPGVPKYQELLYEASEFELADGLKVEVAAPEDIEHYAHVRRTGSAPEIRIRRAAGQSDGPDDTRAPEHRVEQDSE